MSKGGQIAVWIIFVFAISALLWIWSARQSYERAAWTPKKETSSKPIVSLSQPSVLVSDPQIGNPDAPNTIIEFADFRCPHCADSHADLRALFADYPGKMRIIWKDFPLTPPRDESIRAHRAARCAQMQGKFWEYADALFARQDALNSAELARAGDAIGLDSAKFQSCFAENTTAALVERAFAEGQNLGIDGTPAIYVNGKKWEQSIDDIKLRLK